MGFFAIDQIAKIGLSSLQVIYYFEKLFITPLCIIEIVKFSLCICEFPTALNEKILFYCYF
ncbi:hypothetical protein C5469_15005 [Photorhabdus cinerea]|uniref:Uncharacterized protein n=1 Tax=Photorhabdus cinerea TaxID=471575 RepID=A0A7X5QFV6_9GAMM|nr:hypothetical protein [Photorhabdus cinerea]